MALFQNQSPTSQFPGSSSQEKVLSGSPKGNIILAEGSVDRPMGTEAYTKSTPKRTVVYFEYLAPLALELTHNSSYFQSEDLP